MKRYIPGIWFVLFCGMVILGIEGWHAAAIRSNAAAVADTRSFESFSEESLLMEPLELPLAGTSESTLLQSADPYMQENSASPSSATPSATAEASPTIKPTVEPTAKSTAKPTAKPTAKSTPKPTATPAAKAKQTAKPAKTQAAGTKTNSASEKGSGTSSSIASSQSSGGQVATAWGERLAYKRSFSVTATGYSDSPDENGWGAVDYFGNELKLGTIAVDPSIIPMGSKVYVTGYSSSGLPGTGMIAYARDQGSAIKGAKIDIFIPGGKQTALDFGMQKVRVYLLK
ncbi:3D domain-containing protein [Gorillibacterium sp. CAU 1737]|uniref:3D domain-containing protein n=1 Tax=Gorillibacterium sp. CAU 1737 TaxID=3140362 RepID=UPI003260B233